MKVLVDTSIWIDYFRDGNKSSELDFLIDENLLVTNDLILAELIPFLKLKKETKLIQLMNTVTKVSLDINWDQIIDMQVKCLANGLNAIGIPDLIIAQHAKNEKLKIYSLDKHFRLLQQVYKIELYEYLS